MVNQTLGIQMKERRNTVITGGGPHQGPTISYLFVILNNHLYIFTILNSI